VNVKRCSKPLYSIKRTFCSVECCKASFRKDIPSKDILEKALNDFTSMVKVGKYFNVSDNAVRKWCNLYSLEAKAKG
jgi:hypothetical protein